MEVRCYRTILQSTRKSVPRSSRQSDRTNTSYHKEMQTAVVWSCLPFIKSGQNHLARHSERRKKTRQTEEEEVGRQHQGMDRPEVHQVPEDSGEKRKMEETGCEVICGAPTTLADEGSSYSHLISSLTARVVGASHIIWQPVSSILPCSPLPSGTWQTPGLSIP